MIKLVGTWEDEFGEGRDYEIIEEENVVGCISLIFYEEEDVAFVERIDVEEQYRNQGYGTKALQELCGEYWRIYLAAENEDCARLYARLGEETDDEPWSYRDCGYGVYMLR